MRRKDLDQNAKKSFFWCDAEANKDVLAKPFKVIIEFDNPVFFFKKRSRKVFEFDLTPKGIFDPVNNRYDLHNVAQEVARLRESVEKIQEHLKSLR